MKYLKRILFFWVLSITIIFLPAFSFPQSKPSKPKLYTAYNIWRVPQSNMFCINYKDGSNIIPAGTEVSNVKRLSWDQYPNFAFEAIRFKIVKEGKSIKINYRRSWHPGNKINDYKKFMFTTKTFSELTKGMSVTEIGAIKQGKVVVGMSKKAVLISYGRPAEHRTPDLKSDKWRYWMNKYKQKTICFHKGLALKCRDLKKLLQEKAKDEL